MTIQQSATRRTRLRRTLLTIAAVLLAMFGAATGYTLFYSMGTARTLEIPGTATGPKVLIATQGSRFKDAVVNGLLDHLMQKSAHVRVIDVTALPGINETDWDVLVLIHTWEMRKPPVEVKTFVARAQHDKLVVVTTSGAGDFKMEGVDAISSASKMVNVPARVDEVTRRIDDILYTERQTP